MAYSLTDCASTVLFYRHPVSNCSLSLHLHGGSVPVIPDAQEDEVGASLQPMTLSNVGSLCLRSFRVSVLCSSTPYQDMAPFVL